MTPLEFLQLCLAPANLPYTVLLVLVLLYWAVVLLGVLDIAAGTPDLDLEADLDADAGAPAVQHGELASGDDPGGVIFSRAAARGASGDVARPGARPPRHPVVRVLRWCNVGEIPLMVYLSVFVPFLWCASFKATEALAWTGWGAFFALFAPLWIVSAVAAKAATLPMRSLFRKLNAPGVEDHLPLAGRPATVSSLEATDAYGQAEIPMDGAPLVLNVRTAPGARFARGAPVVVVSGPDEKGVYRVEARPDAAPPVP